MIANHAPTTPFHDLDDVVREVAARAEAWVATDAVTRIGLIDDCLNRLSGVYAAWAELGLEARGLTLAEAQAALSRSSRRNTVDLRG